VLKYCEPGRHSRRRGGGLGGLAAAHPGLVAPSPWPGLARGSQPLAGFSVFAAWILPPLGAVCCALGSAGDGAVASSLLWS